ncbi:MAG: carboxypeptidase-like regulatory domain-containing protein [Flavobacterium sp.]|nr:carboxypeptidase-like regulatory domain-containing protein [Flavobacterium sp.]
MKYFWTFCLILITHFAIAQKKLQGQVIDYDNTIPIAFAKITHNGKTLTADWEGRFSITITNEKKPIVFKYKGYFDNNYYVSENATFMMVKMISDNSQKEVQIHSEQTVNNLVKTMIEKKNVNNPEKALESFEYKNYEKVLVSAHPEQISSKIDTIVKRNIFGVKRIKLDSSNYRFKKFTEKQHIYQAEKVNLIQHNQKGTKETIIATRMAGFKQPVYEYLGLKLVSYSIYENPFEIIEIPVMNPISTLGRRFYNYKLMDTLKIQNRNVYRVYFQPKNLKSSSLRGLIYIDAETYGVAKAFYKIYGTVNINATYTFNYMKEFNLWFPEKRKFEVIKGNNTEDLKILGGTIKFNSTSKLREQSDASDQAYLLIESKPFDIKINQSTTVNQPFIKIDIPKESLQVDEKYWNTFSKDSLDKRKLYTYIALDSLSEAEKIEKRLLFGKKIINGYIPFKIIDIDLRSIAKYNNYEGFRLGFGAVTNTKLSEKYKLAFYGAYGLKDNGFKYGITPSYQLDKPTNTWVSLSYFDDLSEIGQIQFATQNRRFRIYDPRPINVSTFYENKTFSAFLESKYIPKTSTYFSITRSEIEPLFDYNFIANDEIYTNYKITTALFAIQWNPFSGYMQTPIGRLEIEKRFPKFSLQITKSIPGLLDSNFDFTKFDFKIEHEIPFLSGQKTAFIFQTGLSNGDIPLTHLYSIAPNNLDKNTLLKRLTFAGKNSFETMYYNEFFSNNYVMLQGRHTFNRLKLAYKINPEISIVTRTAFGTLKHPEQHQQFAFKTLEKGFVESGIEMNKIFKGLGANFFMRYGPNALAKFEDNLSLKISYHLDLGF